MKISLVVWSWWHGAGAALLALALLMAVVCLVRLGIALFTGPRVMRDQRISALMVLVVAVFLAVQAVEVMAAGVAHIAK